MVTVGAGNQILLFHLGLGARGNCTLTNNNYTIIKLWSCEHDADECLQLVCFGEFHSGPENSPSGTFLDPLGSLVFILLVMCNNQFVNSILEYSNI